MLLSVYSFGALRVLVSDADSRVVAVQDKISGDAASLRYSASYIQSAVAFALRAHESQAELA